MPRQLSVLLLLAGGLLLSGGTCRTYELEEHTRIYPAPPAPRLVPIPPAFEKSPVRSQIERAEWLVTLGDRKLRKNEGTSETIRREPAGSDRRAMLIKQRDENETAAIEYYGLAISHFEIIEKRHPEVGKTVRGKRHVLREKIRTLHQEREDTRLWRARGYEGYPTERPAPKWRPHR